MKKIYEVCYSGLWLGGHAIVCAESAEEAKLLIENDPSTVEFKNVVVNEIEGPIYYNDNGDY